MSESFGGGCACGAIRYECSAVPLAMVTCHCRDCQRAGGSAYAPTVVVSRGALRVVRGVPAVYERAADSGEVARREFCRDCGSPLFASSSARPERIGIRAGSLDDPAAFQPARAVFSSSAQPWDPGAR
ncbi:MAG TPA: GFA family protein [Myxococcota bacterium]|nr:GFA family protein [Myxococcota bacterium]